MESVFIYIAELPIWVSIAGVMVLALVVSLAGTVIPNEIYTYQELAANNDIVNTKFSYFGGIFAVSLGLAMVGAYGVYLDARDASTREVGALRSLYYSLPAEGAEGDSALSLQRRSAIVDYATIVIDEDWTVRGQDVPNFNSDIALKKMFDIFMAKPDESPLMDIHLLWLNDAVAASLDAGFIKVSDFDGHDMVYSAVRHGTLDLCSLVLWNTDCHHPSSPIKQLLCFYTPSSSCHHSLGLSRE